MVVLRSENQKKMVCKLFMYILDLIKEIWRTIDETELKRTQFIEKMKKRQGERDRALTSHIATYSLDRV